MYRRGMHEPRAGTRARSSLLARRSAPGAEAWRGAGAEPASLRGATTVGAATSMVRLAMGAASLALRRAGAHARPGCTRAGARWRGIQCPVPRLAAQAFLLQ